MAEAETRLYRGYTLNADQRPDGWQVDIYAGKFEMPPPPQHFILRADKESAFENAMRKVDQILAGK